MYNPYGYNNPYGYPTPFQSQQPQVPSMPSTPSMNQQMGIVNPYTQQNPGSNLDWITVNTVKQVDQVTVQPGAKAWVMVQNEPVFALRVADQMGLITTSYYRFEKYNPDMPEEKDMSEYLTRREFDSFVKSLRLPAAQETRGNKREGQVNESVNGTHGNGK